LATISTEEAIAFGARFTETCSDCDAGVGEPHRDGGCLAVRCPTCHRQMLLCPHAWQDVTYSGFWPGEKVAVKLGWFAKKNPLILGWLSCDRDDPRPGEWGIIPDLNRLITLRVTGCDTITGKTSEELANEFGIDIYED